MRMWWSSARQGWSRLRRFLLYLLPCDRIAAEGESVSESEQLHDNTRRHLLAASFSAVESGSGQPWLRRPRDGAVFLTGFIGILFCFWPLRLPRYYSTLLLLLAWSALYICAACSALLARHLPASSRPSKWWLVLAMPVALVGAELLGVAAIRVSGFRTFGVPSTSRENTLSRGDHVVVDIHYYRCQAPKRKHVVIYLRDGLFFVKRVIAAGGDTIDEPNVQHTGSPPPYLNTFRPSTVPPGRVFRDGR
jgi:hypothetical protein